MIKTASTFAAMALAAVAFSVVAAPSTSAADGLTVNFAPGVDGWSSPRQCGVRQSHPDPLLDSFCHAQTRYQRVDGVWTAEDSPATWSMRLPDGRWQVEITVGDATSHGPSIHHTVHANGVTVHDRVRTSASSPFSTNRGEIIVDAGTLTLTFDGGTRTKIVSLEATPLDPPATSTTAVAPTTTAPPATTAPPPTISTTTPPTTGPLHRLVEIPPGITELDQPLVIDSHTAVRGQGQGVSIVAPGPNYDLERGPLIQTRSGDGPGDHHFHISDLTVDCRHVCEGIAVHGYQFSIRNVTVVAAAGHGLATSWLDSTAEAPQPTPAIEAFIDAVQVQQSGSADKSPVVFDGPHDMVVEDLFISTHLWLPDEDLRPAALELRGGSSGTIIDRLHYWGRDHVRGVVVSPGVTGVRLTNGYYEGARLEQVLLPAANNGAFVSGRVQCFPDFAPLSAGISISGAANTGHIISVQTINCLMGGLVVEDGSAGASLIDITTWRSPLIGTPADTSILRVVPAIDAFEPVLVIGNSGAP